MSLYFEAQGIGLAIVPSADLGLQSNIRLLWIKQMTLFSKYHQMNLQSLWESSVVATNSAL